MHACGYHSGRFAAAIAAWLVVAVLLGVAVQPAVAELQNVQVGCELRIRDPRDWSPVLGPVSPVQDRDEQPWKADGQEGRIPLLSRQWSSDSDKFSFAIIGDKTSGGEGKWPIFDRAAESVNLLAPDFAITVGDQIPGHMQDKDKWLEEWSEYMEHARRINAPLFFTPGNHDIANIECYGFWKEDLGRTYYSFDYKDCHFMVLNTEEERLDGRGPVWRKMIEFAETSLAEHGDSRHTFLFFHKPMWDDPRFEEDWARIETALGDRMCTIVAGHEHYLSSERVGNRLYVIQNATGGGMDVSGVREYGCFHGFGFVTVDGAKVTYAVVEPDGGVWPVDVAPASFRKGIVFDTTKVDASLPEGLDSPITTARTEVTISNPFTETVTVRVAIGPLAETGWKPMLDDGSGWAVEDNAATLELTLEPGTDEVRPLTLNIPTERVPYPPAVNYRVKYKGEWLNKETYNMVEVNAIPLYPMSRIEEVEDWQLVGPFDLGDIDTEMLPDDPAKANPNLFKRFGPEDGYDAERVYDGGLKWFGCETQGWGLLNFNALMGTKDHALGYALCGVHSPVDQLTHATVYADNFSQVVLNGELVEEGQDFGAPGGFVYVPLRLRQGWNTVTVKLINNHGDWFLRFLIADPLDNLKFADHPPADK